MDVGDVLDPRLVERPLHDPMLTSHQRCWPYRVDMNSGRLPTTSNTRLTECQVELPDSYKPMMLTTPSLHALWPDLLGLCLLACKPLSQSRRSICWLIWLLISHDVLYALGSFPCPVGKAWVVWSRTALAFEWAVKDANTAIGRCHFERNNLICYSQYYQAFCHVK